MPCPCPVSLDDPQPMLAFFAPAEPDEVPQLREAVTRVAGSAGFSEGRVHDVRLAVSEALSNCVLHAFEGRERPGTMAVSAAVEDAALVVRVLDDGNGVSVGNPESRGLGMGVEVMGRCADEVRISDCRVHGGTCVLLRFDLRP